MVVGWGAVGSDGGVQGKRQRSSALPFPPDGGPTGSLEACGNKHNLYQKRCNRSDEAMRV